MRDKSIELRDLADAVAATAEQVWAHIARAFQLRNDPSAAILTCERDLWRFAHTLRQTARHPNPDQRKAEPQQIVVILLVELDAPRDLGWVARSVVNTAGPIGDGWRVIHPSAHPNPSALLRKASEWDDRRRR